MLKKLLFMCVFAAASAKLPKESFRGQYCTDPRTMRQHEAYSEWADAYSCTRHRCQPGGRNLAIYTVGCKRVEAPESAIECEEVVEDTNMQFPYCCTRLRCLVVVRGEVWTRVLGQPWEKLPAAPWSHMYKMKKPPPKTSAVLDTKIPEQGPVYELAEPEDKKEFPPKSTRVDRRTSPNSDHDEPSKDRNSIMQENRVQGAITKRNDNRAVEKSTKHGKKPQKPSLRDASEELEALEDADPVQEKDNPNLFIPFQPTSAPVAAELSSQETYVPNAYPVVTQKKRGNFKTFVKAVEPGYVLDTKKREEPVQEEEKPIKEPPPIASESPHKNCKNHHHHRRAQREMPLFHASPSDFTIDDPEKKDDKTSTNLQSLVDAIGTRMRDIESVVQKMTKNVEKKKEGVDVDSAENKFQAKDRSSKYRRSNDGTTEASLYLGDGFNGYFSDSSNAVLKKNYAAKEPKRPPTYMAPIADEHHRKRSSDAQSNEDHKKITHRKKHMKPIKKVKKHHKALKLEKRKRFNKMSSVETDTQLGSNEDNL